MKPRFHTSNQADISINELQTDFQKALHISPFHFSETQLPKKCPTPSKWLQDSSPEYSSLPHFPAQKIPSTLETAFNLCKQTKSRSRKSSNAIRLNKTQQIILPPIRSSQLMIKDQYRSISATPRSHDALYTASAQISIARNRKVLPHRDSYKQLKTINLNYDFCRE